ncbi:hypothetical protein [Rhodopirellula bahusiensis]|uniref:hypothetical protein n=1 Tax=Rhodopirellula bahusiensis TaxID=2014065 RepID=UPI0032641BE7
MNVDTESTEAADLPLMPTRKGYVPIGERLNQDVWHDNFVPKYIVLASAPPTRLTLVGVWLLFGPMVFFSVFVSLIWIGDSQDFLAKFISGVWSCLYTSVPAAVLYKQTQRYLRSA